jgi:hypothetical protein
MATIGENGIHQIEAESRSDAIKGDAIRVEYVPLGGGSSVTGASVIGVDKGSVMSFATDFSNNAITPGTYKVEFIRSDGQTERQIDVLGEDDNDLTIQVTQAESI